MMSHHPFRVCALPLLALLVVTALVPLGAQRRPASAAVASAVVRLSTQTAEEGYVGETRCRACHRAEVTMFNKTPHAHLAGGGSGQPMDCESCHGPGKAHADGEQAARGEDAATAAAAKLIFSFRGSAQDNSARCLTCHAASQEQRGFAHSQHVGVGVDCQSCHAPHLVEAANRLALREPPPAQAQFSAVPELGAETRWLQESLLKNSQPSLCYSCHAAVRAQFAQPFHHRVPEGQMKCTDCHSAHGTETRTPLNLPGWETCTACHADKHGPFVFEHAAVRVEGCAVCHGAHGSTSRFMLNRRESRFLCLQCHGDSHSDQEQVNVPHSRLGFQTRGDCTRCHVAIHGSNFNRALLQ